MYVHCLVPLAGRPRVQNTHKLRRQNQPALAESTGKLLRSSLALKREAQGFALAASCPGSHEEVFGVELQDVLQRLRVEQLAQHQEQQPDNQAHQARRAALAEQLCAASGAGRRGGWVGGRAGRGGRECSGSVKSCPEA